MTIRHVIWKLAASYLGEGEVAMLTPKQSEFLDRYVINAGPSLDQNLDTLGRDERKQKIEWVVTTIKAGYERWQGKLKGLRDKDPRDRLVNYGWIDRDAKAYRAMLEDAKVFMTTADKTACDGYIKRLVQQAEDGRLGMRHDVNLSAENAVQNQWPALARSAKSAGSRKEMLQIIERIEHEMAAMRLSLELAGEKTAIVDKFAPVVAKLREAYDAKVPTFDGKVASVPSADDKEPKLQYNKDVCLKLYDLCGRNWFELKKQYKNPSFLDKVKEKLGSRPKDGEEVMWQLWAYRKAIVDGLIGEACSKFGLAEKGKGWVAVGSTNLESDYDLSVMEHGEKADDWEIVDWFNKQFQQRFGTQPGIMFDTNLYATAPTRAKLSDDPQTRTEKAMAAMARSGQDVGALMKQRRFMSWEEYEDMMNTVLDEMERAKTPPEIIRATRTQFEEADGHYQLAQARTLERSETVLADMIRDLEKQEEQGSDTQRAKKLRELKALQADQARLKSAAENAKGAEQAKLMLERAEMLDGAEDLMLAVNNAIYVEAVKESRKVEELARKAAADIERLEKELEELSSKEPKTEEDNTRIEKAKKELEEARVDVEARAARSKNLFTDAVFFANEAYHTDGPFKHIVEATQAVSSDVARKYDEEHGKGAWKALEDKNKKDELVGKEMKKRRDALSMHDCLQSFNEQLGDFIKDLHHHANDQSEDLPGTGFFRSSKYLDRLIDAVALLEQKATGGLGVKLPGKLATLEDYRKALGEGLLALRKGKIRITKAGAEPEEEQEQMEAFAIAEIRKLFGVSTLHDLGKLFKSFGSQVNAKLRAQVAKEMEALDAQAFFKQV